MKYNSTLFLVVLSVALSFLGILILSDRIKDLKTRVIVLEAKINVLKKQINKGENK